MRFIRDAVITIAVLVLAIGAVTYVQLRAGGLSADVEPGAFERTVATRLVRLSISADAEHAANPFKSDSQAWRTAADHFSDHCAICHGGDGHGRTDLGENMYPKVPDLADPVVQRLSDGALFSIIQNGVRWTGMPAWKHEHTPEDTWKLVSFVRRVPSLTPEELQTLQPGAHPQEGEPAHRHEAGEHHHDQGDTSQRPR